ncbi:MAG: hypothetical protein JST82_07810 [Bacteroidetes bacterium]|nr:hypothetical protein [Bacteroidota bacterium]
MKKYTQVTLAAALLLLGAASCQKKETPAPTTPTTTTPTTPTPVSPTPTGSNIYGALVAIKMDYTITQAGVTVPFNNEIGSAIFYSAPGSSTFVDGGSVSVNNKALDKQSNNSYMKMANSGTTPSSLDLDNSGVAWSVSGNSGNGVPAITYTHSGSFPNYSATMPTSITKSSGISFTFSSSTLTGADSVYVVIASGSKSLTKSYLATAGTVTISASDLSGFATVSDNSALLEVCPFKYIINTYSGKQYVFIKEQAVVRNININ